MGLEKLELPIGFSKDKMSEFQTQNKAAFEAYGLRDAEIAVTYLLWGHWFSNRYLGLQGLSATASSLSVRLAEQCIRKDGVHPTWRSILKSSSASAGTPKRIAP